VDTSGAISDTHMNFNEFEEVHMNDQLLHSIMATAKKLDIGRSSVYGLIEAKKIKAVKIGRRRLITDQSIVHLVDELVAENSVGDE
jgi:excisionase family DNA binding protein